LPTADAKLSFIDARDIAAVACEALIDPHHEGHAYTLTGAEALSHFAVAEKLSLAAGTTISYVPISEEAARVGLAAHAIPADRIERWADFFAKVRKGLCASVSGDLERVLQRPPILFDRYAKDFAQFWR
jgi:uncharacterized protein YbjT (DUF2867 family)